MNTDELRKILVYDHITGFFTWISSKGTMKSGCIAGCVKKSGYRQITISGKKYQAHRLVWLYLTGEWPKGVIDHRNRKRDDNRFDNLRDTTVSFNNLNKSIRSDNKSGITGVSWDSRERKWRATAQINYKQISLGYHSCIYEAARLRAEHCVAVFGDFNPA